MFFRTAFLLCVVRRCELWAAGGGTVVFENHCLDCHDGDTQKGDRSGVAGRLAKRNRSVGLVHDKVEAAMSPKKKRRPKPMKWRVSRSLRQRLAKRAAIVWPGRTRHGRRLNRLSLRTLRERLHARGCLWPICCRRTVRRTCSTRSANGLMCRTHRQFSRSPSTRWSCANTVAHKSHTQKFYAREEGHMKSALRWKPNIQTAATRARSAAAPRPCRRSFAATSR